MVEIEPFGVNYERFSLGKFIRNFVKKNKIKSVLEMPAHGAKACPSLYSLDFALAGCKITLLNGDKKSLKFYEQLGLRDRIKILNVKNLERTGLPNGEYDFVWNFAFIPTYPNKKFLIREMKRISKKYVSIFSVNKLNIGFPMHVMAHKITKITWTHGDKRFNSPFFLKDFFKNNGLKEIKLGVVDCPFWPDSVGFRDIRLHRSNKKFDNLNWDVPYIRYLKEGFPKWIKMVYFFEKLPLPIILKYPYSHIFYVIGKK